MKYWQKKRRESEVLESLCDDAVHMDCSFQAQVLGSCSGTFEGWEAT